MKAADVIALAKELRDTAALAQQPYLDAIAQHGGLVPDMVWDARRGDHGAYVLAGEYEDVPVRALVMPAERNVFRGVRIDGNADEIADALRAQGHDITDGDVRDFVRGYRKPTVTLFMDEAREMIAEHEYDLDPRYEGAEDVLTAHGFYFDGWNGVYRRYTSSESTIVVEVGVRMLGVRTSHVSELPAGTRWNHTSTWIYVKTADTRNLALILGSALINETLAA
jgi:hypothetical protein